MSLEATAAAEPAKTQTFKTLTVVIPTLNEEATILKTIERVKAADVGGLELELIVVDDGSKDHTRELLTTVPGIRTIFHESNRGKGGAVKTGFRAATGDIVLIQDADLEYDPADYRVLLEPIVAGRVEAVMGSRFTVDPPRLFHWDGHARSQRFTHYLGNTIIIALTNLLYGRSATDYEGCYKVFTKRLIEAIPVEADGFEYDNELICKLLRRGDRIEEVPIRYAPRSYEAGKKVKWGHGILMVWTIMKWRFRPF